MLVARKTFRGPQPRGSTLEEAKRAPRGQAYVQGCLQRDKQLFKEFPTETSNYCKVVSSDVSNALRMSQAK
eukprot:4618148-Pyramimonas_sp.AAC.1